ncbi:NCS2 family permease [Candidatus Micrarchaeota archaeon]|nr:NCS2 family permease [Candidatus Micrarchaeota archaeon]
MNAIKERIENYFDFLKHKTSWTTEIFAGVSTFLALSYIFVVNPAILGEGGMNKSAVLFATIVVSALTTLLMGIWAKKPLVLAPGMEINAYIAFYVIGQLGFGWQDALGAVFWSGIIFLLITVTGIRKKIIDSIPNRMKSGLVLCVGVFLGLIALRLAGILTYQGVRLQGLGILFSPSAYVFYIGLIALLIVQRVKGKGAILISIIVATIAAHIIGIGTTDTSVVKISGDMLSAVFQLNLGVITNPKMWNVILVLFLVDFFGNVAKLIGLTRNTTITEKDGSMPQMKEALIVDSVGAIAGSVAGTSSVLTYVESAVGISEGGRTGITAIVCGILMLLFIVLTPIVALVPVIATTGALLWVGVSLFPKINELKEYTKTEIATLVVMIGTVIYTFAIDKALLVGFIVYIAGLIATKRTNEISPYMVISTVLLLIGAIIQGI